MSEYDEIIKEHKKSLKLTRVIIVSLISKLDNTVANGSFNETLGEDGNFLWGEKDNVISVLVKLTGLLVKVVPMEKELLDSEKTEENNGKSSNVGRIINSDDKKIIKSYISKLNKPS